MDNQEKPFGNKRWIMETGGRRHLPVAGLTKQEIGIAKILLGWLEGDLTGDCQLAAAYLNAIDCERHIRSQPVAKVRTDRFSWLTWGRHSNPITESQVKTEACRDQLTKTKTAKKLADKILDEGLGRDKIEAVFAGLIGGLISRCLPAPRIGRPITSVMFLIEELKNITNAAIKAKEQGQETPLFTFTPGYKEVFSLLAIAIHRIDPQSVPELAKSTKVQLTRIDRERRTAALAKAKIIVVKLKKENHNISGKTIRLLAPMILQDPTMTPAVWETIFAELKVSTT